MAKTWVHFVGSTQRMWVSSVEEHGCWREYGRLLRSVNCAPLITGPGF